MKDLLACGQLNLSKIPEGKNPADVLTKHLTASNLHKLLSKLGVITKAADSKDLLSVVNLEMLASPRKEQSSFFIGMMAKHPVTSQLVASRVASRPLPSNSFQQPSQEAVPNLQSSQRPFSLSSFWRYLFFVVALLCAATYVFHNVVSFKMYCLFRSAMLILMKLYRFIVFVYGQFSSTMTSLQRALGTASSVAFRSLSTTSLQRPMLSTNPRTPAHLSASSTTTLPRTALCTHSWKTRFLTILFSTCLGWVASAYQGHSFTAKASFAQTSSFSSFPSIGVSFNIFEAQKMAYFKHDQLIAVLLANEAYTLPPALLQHVMEGTLFNDELEPAWVSDMLPKLPKNDELQFYMVLGEKAMESFEKSNFEQLPPQKVSGSSNANLGNWQASSSFAKAVSFWAWTACRAPELLKEEAYVINFKFEVSRFVAKHKALQLGHTVTLDFRGADCQLCFWGTQQAPQQQPLFGSLHIQLGDIIVKLCSFWQDAAALWLSQLWLGLCEQWAPSCSLLEAWSAAACGTLPAACRHAWPEPSNGQAYSEGTCQGGWRASFKNATSFFCSSQLLEGNSQELQQSFGRSGAACREAYRRTRRKKQLGTEMFQQQPLQLRKLQDALMAALPACRVVKATFRCTWSLSLRTILAASTRSLSRKRNSLKKQLAEAACRQHRGKQLHQLRVW